MIRSVPLILVLAAVLVGCSDEPDPPASPESSAENAAASAPAGVGAQARGAPPTTSSSVVQDDAGVGGGPAGQTPAYGQPGGAPDQVTSTRDGAGPSVGEGSPR